MNNDGPQEPVQSGATSTTIRECRAAVFLGPDEPLELRCFPLPKPGPREALVRVEGCTLCGSDLHTLLGRRREPTPTILGHEIVGVIEANGAPPLLDLDGAPLCPGDRVTWSVAVSCGDCDRCRRGWPQKCRSLAKYGHAVATGRYALSGGLAEYVLLQAGSAVVVVDPTVPFERICPANCATATVAAAMRAAGDLQGRRLLIFGAGMLGLTAAAYGRHLGAESVVVCDPDVDRLTRVLDFGADAATTWTDDPQELAERLQRVAGSPEFDAVFELSGAPSAVAASIRHADVGGVVVLVGTVMQSPPAAFDPERVVRRCLKIVGVHNYAPQDLRAAVDFLTLHGRRYPFESLVSAGFPLQQIRSAMAAAEDRKAVRIAVKPGGAAHGVGE